MSEVRRYGPSDLFPVCQLLRGALPFEGVTRGALLRQVLLDPNYSPEGSLVAVESGSVVGYVYAAHRTVPVDGPAVLDGDTGYVVLLGVAEGFRRRGVGSLLLEGAEAFLRSRGVSRVLVGPFSPGYFAPGVGTEYEDGIAFFLARGYREVYRPLAMKVAMDELRCPDWAPLAGETGFQVGYAAPWLYLPMLEFAREKFGPDWARYVREAARAISLGADPCRLAVAIDASRGEDAVVGFSHYDGERFGPIGVDPDYRGRGIGHALCWRTLEAQREAGFREAYFMWSDDKTAERLYSGFGFREWRRFVLFRKDF